MKTISRLFPSVLFSAAFVFAAVPASWAKQKKTVSYERPLFIAHYMTWFGLPEISGDWYQWQFKMEGLSIDKHHYPGLVMANGRRDIAAIHYPTVGPYDSTDPNLAEYHILLAKDSGIDGFMVNWYGFESDKGVRNQEDKGFENLLRTAERLDFKVCINFDDKCAFPPYRKFTRREEAVEFAKQTLKRVMEKYGSSPAYLRIEGRPVFSNFGWHYATSNSLDQTSFSVAEWKSIKSSLKQFRPYFIHDHQWDWRRSIEDAGFHKVAESVYSWVGKDTDRIAFLEESQKLYKKGKLRMVTGLANPGFDNLPCWGWGGGLSRVSRRDGQEYRDQFEESLRYGSGFLHLVTWNDFTEGSTIEPTEEYGDLYLRITAEYANRFTKTFVYGRSLDMPQKIYSLRNGADKLEKSQLISAEILEQIRSKIQRCIEAFLVQDRVNAEKALLEAQILLNNENKKLPKFNKIQASLSPSSLDIFAGDKAEVVLTLKNPHDENVPFYVELDHYGIPKSWLGELDEVLWLKPNQEIKLTYPVQVPKDAPESVGWFTASVDSPYAPVTSNVTYIHVYRPYLRLEAGPVNLLRIGRDEPLYVTVDSRQKTEKTANVVFSGPPGWVIQTPSDTCKLLQNGSVTLPFTVKVPDNTAFSSGTVVLSLSYGDTKVELREPFGVLREGKAALLKADINQDGTDDYVLGNQAIEVHSTPALGARILAIIYRDTFNNQLFLDYPRVEKTQGGTWDKWTEYGGINDWFPGEWPGEVWNNDWNARSGSREGDKVSVVFSTATKNRMAIQRELSVDNASPLLKVAYAFENLDDKERPVFWTNHPDLAPGGAADTQDVMVVPTPPKDSDQPQIAMEGYAPHLQKKHHVPGENWVLAYDSTSQEYIGQTFDGSLVEKIGLWEGKNFFTMELIFNKMMMAVGEERHFTVNYIVGQDRLDAAIETLRRKKE